jgi:predicted nucleotidyltransferase
MRFPVMGRRDSVLRMETLPKPLTRDDVLARLRAALPDLRARYGVTRLGLFGSVARNEAGPDSDVDLIAEFIPNAGLGFRFFDLEKELSEMVGRTAEIASLDNMNRYIRATVERDLIYVGE